MLGKLFLFEKSIFKRFFRTTGNPRHKLNDWQSGNSYLNVYTYFIVQMLPIIVQLLLHLPSPQKFASDQATADYSLSLLSLTLRHGWLNTLLPILYKVRTLFKNAL
jgi:hypothetical protein